jgi:hypothetical protein
MRAKNTIREKLEGLAIGKSIRVAGAIYGTREYVQANNYVQRIRAESENTDMPKKFSLKCSKRSLIIQRVAIEADATSTQEKP